MKTSALGKRYHDGEIIFRQGDVGDCMYVVLDGKVEVFLETGGQEIALGCCQEGEFLGETAMFTSEVRTASARVVGTARLLTVDKRNLFRRIQEDPSLALRLVEVLTSRVRTLNQDIAGLTQALQDCRQQRLH